MEVDINKLDLDKLIQSTYEMYVFLETKRIIFQSLQEAKMIEERGR